MKILVLTLCILLSTAANAKEAVDYFLNKQVHVEFDKDIDTGYYQAVDGKVIASDNEGIVVKRQNGTVLFIQLSRITNLSL